MNKILAWSVVGIFAITLLITVSSIIYFNNNNKILPRYLKNCGNILEGDLPLNYEKLGIKVIDFSNEDYFYVVEDLKEPIPFSRKYLCAGYKNSGIGINNIAKLLDDESLNKNDALSESSEVEE